MPVCMRACVCARARSRLHSHTSARVYVRACVRACVWVCVRPRLCVRARARFCLCVSVCVWVCACSVPSCRHRQWTLPAREHLCVCARDHARACLPVYPSNCLRECLSVCLSVRLSSCFRGCLSDCARACGARVSAHRRLWSPRCVQGATSTCSSLAAAIDPPAAPGALAQPRASCARPMRRRAPTYACAARPTSSARARFDCGAMLQDGVQGRRAALWRRAASDART